MQPNMTIPLAATPSYTFAETAGEVIKGILLLVEDGIQLTTHHLVQMINHRMTSSSLLRKVVDVFQSYYPFVLTTAFYAACFYNFWCARTVFVLFAAVGILLSTNLFPSRYFGVLQKPLLGRTEAEGNRMKWGILSSAGVNYYLNRTFLDDKFFAILTALFVANIFWHSCSSLINKYVIQLVQKIGIQTVIIKIQQLFTRRTATPNNTNDSLP